MHHPTPVNAENKSHMPTLTANTCTRVGHFALSLKNARQDEIGAANQPSEYVRDDSGASKQRRAQAGERRAGVDPADDKVPEQHDAEHGQNTEADFGGDSFDGPQPKSSRAAPQGASRGFDPK